VPTNKRRPQRVSSAPIRVLHIVRRYPPFVGGTERYVHDLATAQADAGYRVTVLTFDRDVTDIRRRGARLPSREVIDNVRVVRIPGWGTRQFSVTHRIDVLIRLIRASSVVHLHDLRFATALSGLASRLFRRPWIVHTHGLLFHTGANLALKRLAMRHYYGNVLAWAKATIVASSESDRETLIGYCPHLLSRITTLDNAIALRDLIALDRVPLDGKIVVIGRVVASKGIDDLLAALSLVRAVPWSLEIAGEPDAREVRRLVGLAQEYGIGDRVKVTGVFSPANLPRLLSTASLAVFPSRSEGFGIALLEAMAAGVPICARDIPPHRMLVGPDLADCLVDFDDLSAAAERIETTLRLTEESRDALSRRLRARASGFDIERLRRQIDELYQRLMRQSA
jgi:alpha-1,3-mannosyltransferase